MKQKEIILLLAPLFHYVGVVDVAKKGEVHD